MTSPIVQVVWKDEGDFGFITAFTQADLDWRAANPDKIGVPYDPNRVRNYGSREEAQALAREHGAEYVES
jgi:hypothetical protein